MWRFAAAAGCCRLQGIPPGSALRAVVAVFQMWEKGIELCDELAGLYREEVFDYSSLSKILVSMLRQHPPPFSHRINCARIVGLRLQCARCRSVALSVQLHVCFCIARLRAIYSVKDCN